MSSYVTVIKLEQTHDFDRYFHHSYGDRPCMNYPQLHESIESIKGTPHSVQLSNETKQERQCTKVLGAWTMKGLAGNAPFSLCKLLRNVVLLSEAP